jgi:hypothetical protein
VGSGQTCASAVACEHSGSGTHPEWQSTEPWDQNVSSYAIDDGERLLLFDPLAVPSELDALAAERETAIVLTGDLRHHRRAGR